VKKVAIIDYGMGNIDSVYRAIEECGAAPYVTNRSQEIDLADAIILPGVGAFEKGMKNIRELNLEEVFRKKVFGQKVPFLGICLGMQLLASIGHEFVKTEGLGWIPGEVVYLESKDPSERIPHVGWNEVDFQTDSPLFTGIKSGSDFYFVHSYRFHVENKENILTTTPYCGSFVSAVVDNNIFGVQFHPEKSQKVGFLFLKNFLRW
jgi:glutamine amidotransferase